MVSIPGALRPRPQFDWDNVYQRLESLVAGHLAVEEAERVTVRDAIAESDVVREADPVESPW